MAVPFAVLGVGSIGQLIAHALRQHGFPVTLLVRRAELIQQFKAAGARLTCSGGPVGQAAAETAVEANMGLVEVNKGLEVQEQKDIHSLIVATKANNVVDAVLSVKNRLHPDSSIILIQNGMLAVYQELWKKVLSGWDSACRPRVIVGSLTHGAYLRSSFHVFHSSSATGCCTFAEVDAGLPCLTDPGHQQKWKEPQPPALQALLSLHSLAPEHPRTHLDLLRLLQLKLAVNCALNPLTAILSCLNGELLKDASSKDAMRDICGELHTVLGPSAYVSAEEMFEAACQVAGGTAQNRSSMLQDITAGRVTELPYLNGYIMQQGHNREVHVPTNVLLCQLVSFLERTSKTQ